MQHLVEGGRVPLSQHLSHQTYSADPEEGKEAASSGWNGTGEGKTPGHSPVHRWTLKGWPNKNT